MRISKNKNKIVPALIIVLALLAIGLFLLIRHQDKTPISSGSVNLQPATAEEKQQAEDNKQAIIDRQSDQNQPAQPTPTENKKGVAPIITSVEYVNGNVEVSGFVAGVYEDGGTCQAILSKDSKQVTKQSTGLKNVSNTQCPTLVIPKSELANGSWSVVLSYSSTTSIGSSTSKLVEVK